MSGDGQAGFAWFPFFLLDWPSGDLAYTLLGATRPMSALVDWWYRFGQGPNIRALLLFGLFGGLQWFLIGAICGGSFAWLRTRWRSVADPLDHEEKHDDGT